MRLDIGVFKKFEDSDYTHVGSIRLVGGKAVPELAVQNCMVSSIPTESGEEVTPDDGRRYLQLLGPELSQSRISAVLVNEEGDEQ